MYSLNKNQGFGIIEVVVTLAIVVIIVIGVAQVISSVYHLYSASTAKTQALAYTQQSLELINDLKNDFLACSCSVNDCVSSPGYCLKNGQSCELFQSYTSCWLPYPDGHIGQNLFNLKKAGSLWQLDPIAGPVVVDENPKFSREIIIENLKRDNDGNINASGSITDYATKKVIVNIYWQERGRNQMATLSNIYTAWQNL